MYKLEIIIAKDALNYAEALTTDPFNISDALDKVGYYKHTESARVEAIEEEIEPFITIVTSATLLVRANAYNPEDQIRYEVAKLIKAMGGNKKAQIKAIEHALILLDIVLSDSAVGKTSVQVDENGDWIKPSIPPFPSLEEDENTDYCNELTLRDINRQQVAIDEAFSETIQEIAARGNFYDINKPLTIDEIAGVFYDVRSLVKRLESVPYAPRTKFDDYSVYEVFSLYADMIDYLEN